MKCVKVLSRIPHQCKRYAIVDQQIKYFIKFELQLFLTYNPFDIQ